MALVVKNPPANAEDTVQSLGQEDPLEEEMATHSSILAWRISWTGEPGGLQFMGSQRVTGSFLGLQLADHIADFEFAGFHNYMSQSL